METFRSERIYKTESITLKGPIEKVFPLFGPIEEKNWADGWNPVLIYPLSGIIEEGMVFITEGHGHNETDYNWIISKYQPESYFIEYIVSTNNRYWVITVKCSESALEKTEAAISYTYTGLNNKGNEINKHSAEKMFKKKLKDWEDAINYYLKTGKKLKDH